MLSKKVFAVVCLALLVSAMVPTSQADYVLREEELSVQTRLVPCLLGSQVSLVCQLLCLLRGFKNGNCNAQNECNCTSST